MPIDPRGIAVISGSGQNWADTKFRSLDNGEHYFSGSLTITSSGGNKQATALSASGIVKAYSFSGDGSNLTGITAEWDGSHAGNASITGDLTLGDDLIMDSDSAVIPMGDDGEISEFILIHIV